MLAFAERSLGKLCFSRPRCPEAERSGPRHSAGFHRKTESVIVSNCTFTESAAFRCSVSKTYLRYHPPENMIPRQAATAGIAPVAAPNGNYTVPVAQPPPPSSPGFPKGPQPLGTLTLPARSSVLYLRARDRHTRRQLCAFPSCPGAKGYRAPLPSPFP